MVNYPISKPIQGWVWREGGKRREMVMRAGVGKGWEEERVEFYYHG